MALIILLLLLINPSWAFVLTERVGKEIDFEEAAKYKLFQNVKDFKQAKFKKVDIGKYEMVIELAGDSIAIPLKANSILAIKDYLENFEKIENSKEENQDFEKRNNISSYDIFGIPITGEEVKEAIRGKERLGCILGGSSLGLFIGSIFGWSNAVEYVGHEHHTNCLTYTYNIYQVNRPLFLAYSTAGGGAGAGIGYYAGTKWDLAEAKNKAKMRGFAYFNADTIISEQEIKKSLRYSNRTTCLLIGIPLSGLAGLATMMFAYYAGHEIQGIEPLDKIIGEEIPSIIAVTIGIGTAATLIEKFLRIGNDLNRKEAINRIKRKKQSY